MTNTFEFTGKAGTFRIEATYEEVLEEKTVDLDGDVLAVGKEPTTAGKCNMVAYLNGERIDSCWDPTFWRLIDVNQPGIKKIWGIKVGMTQENAEKYEQFLAELIEAGTSDEVKAFWQVKAAKEHTRNVENAKKTIAKAEAQGEILPAKEVARKQKIYNNINNDGGEGYVPDWVTLEEYEAAKAVVAAN